MSDDCLTEDALGKFSARVVDLTWEFVKECGQSVEKSDDSEAFAITDGTAMAIVGTLAGQLGVWLQVAVDLGVNVDELTRLVGAAVKEGREGGSGVAKPLVGGVFKN